ncbi:hypothetical protein MBLNU230_g3254t1 [Neophaeotheca triangularis]
MAPTGSDVFPTLRTCLRLQVSGKDDVSNQSLYDVKFYPWPTADDDAIFVVTGERQTFICCIDETHKDGFEILHWWKDADQETSQNSVAWARDPETGKPLICLAGHTPKYVKIIDAETGKIQRVITGHGRGVNDLAIHPLSPHILATAAEDHNVRFFNLHPKYAKQPCVHILAGGGSKQPLMGFRFHPNGKWMLTGGMDTAVCLWHLPPVEELADPPFQHSDDADNALGEPEITYYPHFASTEVHHNYVDCLEFYGDLIISRAAKDMKDKTNEILIWKIDGFSADATAPTEPPVPRPGEWTRSAFAHGPSTRGFQILLTLSMPETTSFYLRFSLLHQPSLRPILAMGNQASKVCMWDLSQLELGEDPAPPKSRGPRRGGGRGGASSRSKASISAFNLLTTSSRRGESVGSDATPTGTATPTTLHDQLSSTGDMASYPNSHNTPPTGGNETPTANNGKRKSKLQLEDPFNPLKPHFAQVAQTDLTRDFRKDRHFDTRQMAWSPDGRWLVGVGQRGMLCLFGRERGAGLLGAGD